MHAFEFKHIGQGAPHDLSPLTKQRVSSTLAGVGSQQSVEAEFLSDAAHQGEHEGRQGEDEEEFFAAHVAPDFGVLEGQAEAPVLEVSEGFLALETAAVFVDDVTTVHGVDVRGETPGVLHLSSLVQDHGVRTSLIAGEPCVFEDTDSAVSVGGVVGGAPEVFSVNLVVLSKPHDEVESGDPDEVVEELGVAETAVGHQCDVHPRRQGVFEHLHGGALMHGASSLERGLADVCPDQRYGAAVTQHERDGQGGLIVPVEVGPVHRHFDGLSTADHRPDEPLPQDNRFDLGVRHEPVHLLDAVLGENEMASPGHGGTDGVDGHPGREYDTEGDEPHGEHLLVVEQLSEDSGDDPVHRVLIEAKRRLSIPREIGPPSSPQVLVLPGLSARDRSSVDFSVARRALSQAHWPRSFRCFLECLHTPIDAPERPFFVNIFNILRSYEIMPDLEGIPQTEGL